MTGAELLVIQQGADMVTGGEGGGGIFSGDDKNQFEEQLDMSDPSNQAYEAWCKEFAPEKISGASSIWDAPKSIYQFREGVQIPIGHTWAMYIGKINEDYTLRQSAAATATANVVGAAKVYGLWIVGGIIAVVLVWMMAKKRNSWKR